MASITSLIALLLQLGLLVGGAEVLQETAQALAKEQSQFEHWCNATLVAQRGRHFALQQLLAQAQAGFESSFRLEQLRGEVAGSSDAAEKAQASQEADSADRQRKLVAAQFSSEDATRDVEALTRAQKALKDSHGHEGGGSDALASLLTHARKAAQKYHSLMQLLQTNGSSHGDAVSAQRMEEESTSKPKSVEQLELQVFTAQRSLDVLTAAIEDESAYLADLQTVCSIGQRVYSRMEKGSLVALQHALESLSAPGGGSAEAGEKKAAQNTLAAALSALPVAPALAASPHVSAPAEEVAAATSPPEEDVSQLQTNAAPSKPLASDDHSADQALKTAPTAPHAASPMAVGSGKSAAKFFQAVQKKAVQKKAAAHASGKRKHRTPAHHKMVKARAAPAAAVALHSQKRASSSKVSAPPSKPSSDASIEAAQQQAAQQQAQPSEGDVQDAATPAAHSGQVHSAPEDKPKKKVSFMEGIYDSAVGAMPSEYAAWSPGGGIAKRAHASLSLNQAGNALAHMGAMFGDSGDESAAPSTEPPQAGTAAATAAVTPAPQIATEAPIAATAAPQVATEAPSVATAAPQVATEAPSAATASHPEAKTVVDADTEQPAQRADSDGTAKTQLIETAPAAPAAASVRHAAAKLSTADAAGAKAADDAKAAGEDEAKADVQQADVKVEAHHRPAAAESLHDTDLDPADDDSAAPAAPTKLAAVAEASTDDDADDSDAADAPPSTAPPHHRPPPKGTGGMMSALSQAEGEGEGPAPKNAPEQFTAWSASDAAAAKQKQEAVLAQLEADFDDDAGTQAPPAATGAPSRHHKKHKHHKKHAVAAVALKHQADDETSLFAEHEDAPKPKHHKKPTPAAPASKPAAADDDDSNVVYDDDDLPKHHRKPLMLELSGGWRSIMRSQAPRKPRLDPDVAVMQSLYTPDGGLPSQYTAWTPGGAGALAGGPAAAAPAAPAAAQDDGADEAGDDQGASFLQLSLDGMPQLLASAVSDPDEEAEIEQLIHSAVGTMQETSSRIFAPSAFLEQSAVRADAQRAAAARVVLQEYAEVLQSQALRKLAHANPNPTKLASLWQRLSAADPLTHPGAMAARGKQAQAEQWCAYFQKNKPTVPAHQALVELQSAKALLANMTAQHAAVSEEVDARVQLQRTVEQDVQGLTSVLSILHQGASDSLGKWAQNFTNQLATSSNRGLLGVGEAVEGIREGHVELADALEAALVGRSAVLQMQRQKLAALQQDATAGKDHALTELQARTKNAQSKVSSMRRKLVGIGRSCDSTLRALEHRRHAGHMEAHAVEMALKVLGKSV